MTVTVTVFASISDTDTGTNTLEYPIYNRVQNAVDQKQEQRDQTCEDKNHNRGFYNRIAIRPGYFKPFQAYVFNIIDYFFHHYFFNFGRGGRNRTLTKGFGDLYSTVELHPCKVLVRLRRFAATPRCSIFQRSPCSFEKLARPLFYCPTMPI